MKFYIFGFFAVLTALNLYANDDIYANNLCEKLTVLRTAGPREKESKFKTLKNFKDRFIINNFPKSSITLNQIDSDYSVARVDDDQSRNYKKVVYLAVKKVVLDSKEKKELKELKAEYKKIVRVLRKNQLIKKLKVFENKNACLQLINDNYEDFKEIQKADNFLNSNHVSFEKQRESEFYSQVLKSTNSFLKDGWTIVNDATFSKISQSIQNDVENAIIISHASQNGTLYDSQGKEFPNGYFKSLPSNLKKLAVYSCHGEAVSKSYQLNDKNNSFHYIYPQIAEKYKYLFDNTVPVKSLSPLLKFMNRPSKQIYASKRRCSIDMRTTTSVASNIYLNNSYIGTTTGISGDSNQFLIRCEDLKLKNYLEAFTITKTILLTPFLGEVSIKNTINETNNSGVFKDYVSKTSGEHIVSKYTF